MVACTDIIPKAIADELAHGRHLPGRNPFYAQETIDGIGRLEHFELAGWIRPLVALRGREQDRPRRTKSHQAILVKGQPLGSVIELFEVGIKPMWKTVVNRFDGFSDFPTARS